MGKAGSSKLAGLENEIIEKYKGGVTVGCLCKQYNCTPPLIYKLFKRLNVAVAEQGLPITKDQIVEFERLYNQGISVYAIAEQCSASRQSIENKLHDLGYDLSGGQRKRKDGPLGEHTSEIIQLYESGIGCFKLSKQFNTAETSIIRLLRKNNIEIRELEPTYSVNETFFENVDNENTAYTLGMLVGDGNVEAKGCFRLALTDKDIVYQIRDILKYTGPIHTPPIRGKAKKQQYLLCVGKKKMYNDLLNLGCGHNKTYNLKFPSKDIVPREMLHHYIRGFFDADGSITLACNNPNVSFIATRDFVEGIQRCLSEILGIPGSVFRASKGANPIITILRFGGRHQIAKFSDWLYQDATIFLDRKFQRFRELKHK